MKVTIKEIASICGLSIGTVDRALHGRKGINPESREKILNVAHELGYRPHLPARSLVTGSTMSVGVVVPDLKNPYFSETVEVIQRKARAADYHVYMMLSEFEPQEEMESLDRLRALNVDGIIILPVNRGRAFQTFLKSLSTPIVTIANKVSKQWAWVGIDDRGAVRDAVRLVISRGYSRIYFVTLGKDQSVGSFYSDEERIKGYRDALAEAGESYVPMQLTDADLIRMIEQGSAPEPGSCIVCSCDAVALDVMIVLKRKGVSIPADVGLMGFDNLEELKYITPRLTTVASPIRQIGEAAFDSLMAVIRGDPIGSRTFPHTIIEGETL